MKKQWVFNPHSCGIKTSKSRKIEVENLIQSYADQNVRVSEIA